MPGADGVWAFHSLTSMRDIPDQKKGAANLDHAEALRSDARYFVAVLVGHRAPAT